MYGIGDIGTVLAFTTLVLLPFIVAAVASAIPRFGIRERWMYVFTAAALSYGVMAISGLPTPILMFANNVLLASSSESAVDVAIFLDTYGWMVPMLVGIGASIYLPFRVAKSWESLRVAWVA